MVHRNFELMSGVSRADQSLVAVKMYVRCTFQSIQHSLPCPHSSSFEMVAKDQLAVCTLITSDQNFLYCQGSFLSHPPNAIVCRRFAAGVRERRSVGKGQGRESGER